MEHQLIIQKTARYYTYGNRKTAKNIWIILHGYGQLAQYFIKKFDCLNEDDNFIVAPEGFHRFYRNGTDGRVGASWMTKEARLDDIEDNIKFLNLLAKTVLKDSNFKRKVLLGFSQGGATAARWHFKGIFKADVFILWASVFPPDVPVSKESLELSTSKNYFVVGKSDPYFLGKEDELEDYLPKEAFTILHFDGMHAIDKETLLKIEKELDN